jgi:polysaccharide export outer membrane protein
LRCNGLPPGAHPRIFCWLFPGRRGRPANDPDFRIPLPRTLTTLAAAALLWGAALAPARAQTSSPRTMPPAAPSSPPSSFALPGADTARPETPTPAPVSGPLVDAPVSRTAYPLGPGDVLSVAVFGEFSHVYSVPVTPEGTVVIPEMGIARVLGLNLDQAQERVRAVVSRFYRGVDVTVTLSRIRTFKVFVVGDVSSPGVRIASAATRVSEVVPPTAGTTWRRNLLLRRAGGDSVRVDLARFMLLGDPSANPTLREGDAVVVPPADLRVDTYGGLRFTGAYEYRPGESLADFLYVANAGSGFPSNSADTLRVVRFLGPNDRREYRFSQAEAMGERGRAFLLQPFDGIFTPTISNFKEQTTATVAGEVVHPGVYPIRSDTTTVRELVEMAGGFTPRASLTQARLTRQPGPETRGEAQLRAIPAEQLTREERQIVQVRAASNANAVVFDFRQLYAQGEDAYRQTVHADDRLDIPEQRSEVVVLGAVRDPGIVPYVSGQLAGAYVARAGGATRRADVGHAVIVRARSGTRERVRDNPRVDEGDTVILPYREERDSLDVIRTSAAVLSSITGLIVSIVFIFR